MGLSTGSEPGAALLITSWARQLHLATVAIFASLLNTMYPLGRSPSCRVASAVLTIWGRFETYCPNALNLGFTLIWPHPCSHCTVQCSSSLWCSVMDLLLSKRSPGSGIFQWFAGLYMTELEVLTDR